MMTFKSNKFYERILKCEIISFCFSKIFGIWVLIMLLIDIYLLIFRLKLWSLNKDVYLLQSQIIDYFIKYQEI